MLVAISSYPVLKPLEKINTKDYLSKHFTARWRMIPWIKHNNRQSVVGRAFEIEEQIESYQKAFFPLRRAWVW